MGEKPAIWTPLLSITDFMEILIQKQLKKLIIITNLEDLWHWQRYARFVVLLVSCPVSLDPGNIEKKKTDNGWMLNTGNHSDTTEKISFD